MPPVAFFRDADEVYEYVGGVIRTALDHPQVGPRLAAADLVVQLYLTEPDASMTVRMTEPMVVEDAGDDPRPDVVLRMRADQLDRFWRGDYNLAIALKRGKLEVEGEVERFLAIVPEVRPLFPRYRQWIARKDRSLRL